MINKFFLALICVILLNSCEFNNADPIKIIKITTEHGDLTSGQSELGIIQQKKYFYYTVALVQIINILKYLILIFLMKILSIITMINLDQH